ncbi:MAG: hypothetical protein AAFY99_00340 [Pseudomonadota bacterium]
MFTETETGTRFSIEIPIEISTFWFFAAWAAAGLVVFALAVVFAQWANRAKWLSWLPKLHERDNIKVAALTHLRAIF